MKSRQQALPPKTTTRATMPKQSLEIKVKKMKMVMTIFKKITQIISRKEKVTRKMIPMLEDILRRKKMKELMILVKPPRTKTTVYMR